MIRAEQLSKSYGRRLVLKNLDLQAYPGTCTVLLGANGAGKTTLLRTLSGLSKPDTGSITVNGLDQAVQPDLVRQQLGFFSHETLLYSDLTVLQNLLFYSRLYQVPDPDTRIETLLEQAGMTKRRDEPVRSLSHGFQQRLALLRTILHDPAVLLLDEPTRGLDRSALAFLEQTLLDSANSGKTILLTTHQPGGLQLPTHKILQLQDGTLHPESLPSSRSVNGEEKNIAYRSRPSSGSGLAGTEGKDTPSDYKDRASGIVVSGLEKEEILSGQPAGGSTGTTGSKASAGTDTEEPAAEQNTAAASASDHPPSNIWNTIAAIFRKDLAVELRRRQLLASLLIFSVLILFIFHFSLELLVKLRQELFSGILWTAVLFSGAIGFEYTMSVEDRAGGMDGLRLAPVRRPWIYLGKLLGNLFFLLLMELVLIPVSVVLSGVDIVHPGFLLLLLLGTIGYAAAGTLFSVMSARTRTRELMLPLLLFPIVLPLVIPGVQAGSILLAGGTLGAVQNWINLLIGYDILLLATILLLFDFVVEE